MRRRLRRRRHRRNRICVFRAAGFVQDPWSRGRFRSLPAGSSFFGVEARRLRQVAEPGLAPGEADADINERIRSPARAGEIHYFENAISLAGYERDRLPRHMVGGRVHTENQFAGAEGIAHRPRSLSQSGRPEHSSRRRALPQASTRISSACQRRARAFSPSSTSFSSVPRGVSE